MYRGYSRGNFTGWVLLNGEPANYQLSRDRHGKWRWRLAGVAYDLVKVDVWGRGRGYPSRRIANNAARNTLRDKYGIKI